LGRDIASVLTTTRTFLPTFFDVATGNARLHGTLVDCDPETGRASNVQRLAIDEATAAELKRTGTSVRT
ncbi:MAG TPA: hypothetical protein VIY86_12845, partial [Pirellulaceae bacterium]